MPAKPAILLVHGFHRDASRMQPMAEDFRSRGFEVFIPDLPTTRERLVRCAALLGDYAQVHGLLERTGRPLHLVGHSYGGLILRALLATHNVPDMLSLTCLGSTHYGTRIADVFCKFGRQRKEPPLLDFCTPGPQIAEPMQGWPALVHLIAGNRNALWWGRLLLPSGSDGRLTIQSSLGIPSKGQLPIFPDKVYRSILDLDHHQLMDPGFAVDAVVQKLT